MIIMVYKLDTLIGIWIVKSVNLDMIQCIEICPNENKVEIISLIACQKINKCICCNLGPTKFILLCVYKINIIFCLVSLKNVNKMPKTSTQTVRVYGNTDKKLARDTGIPLFLDQIVILPRDGFHDRANTT